MSDDRSLPVNPVASVHRPQENDTDAPAEEGPAPADLGRPAAVQTPVPGQGLDTAQVERLENEDTNRPGDDDALQEGTPRPGSSEAPDPTEATLPGDELDAKLDERIEEGEARPGGTDEL